MIVGHKVITGLTAVRRDYRGPWEITEHVETYELHATKGFRKLSHHRKVQTVSRLPYIREWRACNTTTFIPTEREAKERKLLKVTPITPAMLMRHRERRRDAQIAENIARNKKEDQRLAGLR